MKLCMNVALHRIFQIFQTFKKFLKLFQIFQIESKFFLNVSDSNTTNFVKDIFIISAAEDIVGRCKNQFKFWKKKKKKKKKNTKQQSKLILGKVTIFHEIWMSY